MIQILDKATVSQMCAGEVVCRPANVVKELIENSIDAGATRITVSIRQGGRNQILVVDDGTGMDSCDAVLAFSKHATSKIRTIRDLTDNLRTNGFRGEALPSIASVATVTLTTRQEDSELGTCVVFNDGALVEQSEVSCPKGTSVDVANLFAPVPARRRFLKKDSIEAHHCIDAFIRIALIYTDVAFVFYSEGTKIYDLQPASQRQRINDIYGKKYEKHLIPIHCDSACCSLTGFIGSPQSASIKCSDRLFFVNGRYIENAQLRRAINNGYDQLIPKGTKTPFFVHITVNPKEVDVNASPSKSEAVFANESSIWAALTVSVREALNNSANVPTLQFVPEQTKLNIGYSGPSASVIPPKTTVPTMTTTSAPVQVKLFADDDHAFASTPQPALSFIQHQASYIITTSADGILVINQERASERIQYERFMSRLTNYAEVEQGELFSDMLTDGHQSETQFDTIHRVAMTKARRNGVASGQILSEAEMAAIYRDLMECQNSRFTPTGEPISTLIPIDHSIL